MQSESTQTMRSEKRETDAKRILGLGRLLRAGIARCGVGELLAQVERMASEL